MEQGCLARERATAMLENEGKHAPILLSWAASWNRCKTLRSRVDQILAKDTPAGHRQRHHAARVIE